MNDRSRSTLFLLEQIVVIMIFAICAAVCVYILVVSYLMTADAVDTKYALLVAESVAEAHRAFGADTRLVAEVIGGSYTADSVVVYFNNNWEPYVEAYAAFVLRLTQGIPDNYGVMLSEITVHRIITSDELMNLTFATRSAG